MPPDGWSEGGFYIPMQLVVPRAVRMAVAMVAISWAINFAVSFFVMFLMVLRVKNLAGAEGSQPPPLITLSGFHLHRLLPCDCSLAAF
jgi:hypothetical protein